MGPSALPGAIAARWYGKRREGPAARTLSERAGPRHALGRTARPAHRAIGIREKRMGPSRRPCVRGGTGDLAAPRGAAKAAPGDAWRGAHRHDGTIRTTRCG